MASFIYDILRINIMGEDTHTFVDLDDDTLGMFFVDEADDTPNQTSDQDVADRAGASQVPAFASAPNLANAAVTAASNTGMLDADDLVFTSLSGDASESIDLFKDTGTDTTSVLISNHDDYTGLPFTPSGGNVTLAFHANGIIRI
jgi:hypothetical protein